MCCHVYTQALSNQKMVNAIQTKLWGYDLAIFEESHEINSENPPYVKYHILLEMVC